MEITKYCGNCGHYQHGNIENPCPINVRYVGYLKSGCSAWKAEVNEKDDDRYMKVCKRCGGLLHTRHFKKGADICMECKDKMRKRKN